MSADNYLWVTRSGDMYEVYHLFMSDEHPAIERYRPIYADETRDGALRFAHTWARDNVCEYGVRVDELIWEDT